MLNHIVYILQAQILGLLKIGCTKNFSQRMVDLQVGSPDELTLLWRSGPMTQSEAFAAERYLHEKFAAFHVRGEWHSPAPELLSFIKDVAVACPSDIYAIRIPDTSNEVNLTLGFRQMFPRKTRRVNKKAEIEKIEKRRKELKEKPCDSCI